MNEEFKNWIDAIKAYLKKKILGDIEKDPWSDKDTEGILTRQKLLDSIEKHFCKTIAMRTTRKSLLFNTSFMIYLNEEDYNDQEQPFGFTVKEAVNTFHEIIVKMKSRYPDYCPHAS